MSGDFSPLLTKRALGADSGTFRVKVVPASADSGPFVPHPVPSPAAAGSAGGHPEAKPTVTVRKEGDRVAGIRIECSCGQVIELACQYA